MDSKQDDQHFCWPGFPIRRSPGQSLVDGYPELFAATRVLHRLLAPRHPPHALSSLITSKNPKGGSLHHFLFFRGQNPVNSRPARYHASIPDSSILPLEITPTGLDPVEIEIYPSYAIVKEQKLCVELTGIEPATSSLQSWRSPS